jgi:hypothetical protein
MSLPPSYVAGIKVVKGRKLNPHQLIRPKGKSHASFSHSVHHQLIIFDFIRSLPKKYGNAGLRVNLKAKSRSAASSEDDIEAALGGLDDKDAEAERPAMFLPLANMM